MTSYQNQTLHCGNCGQSQAVCQLLSTNSSGSPDLDLRPGGMARNTFSALVQRCQHCGYCAKSIQELPSLAARCAMTSGLYKQAMQRQNWPHDAVTFYRLALIADAEERHGAAAWALVQAAWSCDRWVPGADDAAWLIKRVPRSPPEESAEESPEEGPKDSLPQRRARLMRLLAARGFCRAMKKQDWPCGHQVQSQIVLLDLWRRAGQYGRALELAQLLSRGDPLGEDRFLQDILRLQTRAARARDAGRHCFAEAEQTAPDWAEREARRIAVSKAAEAKAHTRRLLIKLNEAARTAPAQTLAALLALYSPQAKQQRSGYVSNTTASNTTAPAGLELKAISAVQLLQQDLKPLPITPFMGQVMRANVKAYGWPADASLAALGLVLSQRLVHVEPGESTPSSEPQNPLDSPAPILALWRELCVSHGAIVAYLSHCLRDVQAQQWQYAPAQSSSEGPRPPSYL